MLQNQVALDHVLAQQGGTCPVVGLECCTDIFNPTNNLTQYIKDLDELHDYIARIDQVNSDWLGAWLGSWWQYGHEIVLCFMVLCVTLLLNHIMVCCCCLCVSRRVRQLKRLRHLLTLTTESDSYI